MAWDHLSINRPHLVYIILGVFTSLFMLCSSVIKERLYIGEATVATICGIIVGPHAANLINPLEWGNTDQITLEFSRIVLVVQCFAVGVELPKAYMEKHWRSVTMLLIPVMAFGWLVTSLFIWWMFSARLSWLDSLCIAACVTATDPVLASSVVGKGKFSKRVPKHLRDLLSAESGCNDGLAFPFVYLAIYLIRYRPDAGQVAFHWLCISVLYECIFGAVFGFIVGYIARRAIRVAHERELIDRESFLVFYFVLALFCAGSGSILGMDDLLVGFACGVGFSNDGWFQEKTEESHVSDVIDLLINLTFFVYFGTIIPWEQFNSAILGTSAWRLVVVGLLVLFLRRIPIMVLLKPVVPDIKTWREALFAGHFGPIGVGAIFVAILARAELETESTTPLAVIPEEGFEHLNVIELIWPITTFLVITSIIVHGSSVAVFTLGRRINTLNLTMAYTISSEDGQSSTWIDRLPMVQSRSRSRGRPSLSTDLDSEKRMFGDDGTAESATGTEERAGRRRRRGRSRRLGGRVDRSAIIPMTTDGRPDVAGGTQSPGDGDSDTDSADDLSQTMALLPDVVAAVFIEGKEYIFEDEDGNVLAVTTARGENAEEELRNAQMDALEQIQASGTDGDGNVSPGGSESEHDRLEKEAQVSAEPTPRVEAPAEGHDPSHHHDDHDHHHHHHHHHLWQDIRRFVHDLMHHHHDHAASGSDLEAQRTGDACVLNPAAEMAKKSAPARAYQFGNTIILEDAQGEVIRLFDIPSIKKGVQAIRAGTTGGTAPVGPGWTKETLMRLADLWQGPRPAQVCAELGQVTDATSSQQDRPQSGRGGVGLGKIQSAPQTTIGREVSATGSEAVPVPADPDDRNIRFITPDGRRLNQEEFITALKTMDLRHRQELTGSNPTRPANTVAETGPGPGPTRPAPAVTTGPNVHDTEHSRADTTSASVGQPGSDSTGTVTVPRRLVARRRRQAEPGSAVEQSNQDREGGAGQTGERTRRITYAASPDRGDVGPTSARSGGGSRKPWRPFRRDRTRSKAELESEPNTDVDDDADADGDADDGGNAETAAERRRREKVLSELGSVPDQS